MIVQPTIDELSAQFMQAMADYHGAPLATKATARAALEALLWQHKRVLIGLLKKETDILPQYRNGPTIQRMMQNFAIEAQSHGRET